MKFCISTTEALGLREQLNQILALSEPVGDIELSFDNRGKVVVAGARDVDADTLIDAVADAHARAQEVVRVLEELLGRGRS